MKRFIGVLAAVMFLPAAAASAAAPPPGSTWTQASITSAGGVKLHADILRPTAVPAGQKVPVILSIGPYFNHSGEVGPAGPIEDATYDPVGPNAGPSDRFYDFINQAKLMERGYAFVMVDLRGFGGSGGCLDWVGPGEQADVKAAVEWAASQPWSSGSVGMYGKSYDAVTGLVGATENPTGLKAVVSQEPLYDMYRYLYSNGVRFENSAGTPALYDLIAAAPGPLLDDPSYNLSGGTSPACLATNYADQQDSNHDSAYWKARDLITKAPGGHVPLFLTQGFLEDNTKPDGAWDFYDSYGGPKRAWFGMWDHVRGNDVDATTGRLAMGRHGWIDETMDFYDHYLKGTPLQRQDPPVSVETSDGTWRAESTWPPVDSTLLSTGLKTGSYTDDGQTSGTGTGAGTGGVWTISPPLTTDAIYSGVPKVTLDLGPSALAMGHANVVVDVYDIDAARKAILLSRNTSLVPADGKVTMELYGNDWKIPAGHRVGVLVSGANSEWWLHVPTQTPVTIKSGTIGLPFLQYQRPDTIEGGPSIRLDEWLKDAPFTLDEQTVTAGTSSSFTLPGPLKVGSVPTPTATTTATVAPVSSVAATPTATAAIPTATATATVRPTATPGSGSAPEEPAFRLRVKRKGHRLVVRVIAPSDAPLKLRLYRGRRVVRHRKVTPRDTRVRLVLHVKRAGRYRVRLISPVAGRVTSRRIHVRA